ncbi:MAG: RNA methyltransferase [Pirellulaceae bacterium]|nr:RNA methyltransferase [Pirellulaceae bacterium]
MNEFIHQRHKPPSSLNRPRELIVALPPMRSNVNLARIVRAAGCCGVTKVIACGNQRVDPKIARDALSFVALDRRRSLPPVLKDLSAEGYQLVGLEQSSDSKNLHTFKFDRKSVLVIGHERDGISDEVLRLLDEVVEIPVYGMPFSYNVATAGSMALYEYCRQFPSG